MTWMQVWNASQASSFRVTAANRMYTDYPRQHVRAIRGAIGDLMHTMAESAEPEGFQVPFGEKDLAIQGGCAPRPFAKLFPFCPRAV
jgi:hypothetical protein